MSVSYTLLSSLFVFFLFFLVNRVASKIPVIIDTDIGTDIDDSWAVALSLKRPELDIKLILTATFNTINRAKIVAKFLTIVGRTDIPIGVGLWQNNYVGPLDEWSSSFNLSTYKGKLFNDGIGEAIRIIESSPDPVTIMEIAPVSNIKEFLKRRPDLASKVNIKAMSGSIKICYGGRIGACPEYNVATDLDASQQFYATAWHSPMMTAPIDVGYLAVLDGAGYQSLLRSNNLILRTLLECYDFWHAHGGGSGYDPTKSSTTLWDPVAAYLTWSNDSFVEIQTLKIVVTNRAITDAGSVGQPVLASLSWGSTGLQNWQNEVEATLLQ